MIEQLMLDLICTAVYMILDVFITYIIIFIKKKKSTL